MMPWFYLAGCALILLPFVTYYIGWIRGLNACDKIYKESYKKIKEIDR